MSTIQDMLIGGVSTLLCYDSERRMQVNRENPSELKAAKLARSMARGVEDRDLKPNTKERQQIEAVIVAPPNRHATVTPNIYRPYTSTCLFICQV